VKDCDPDEIDGVYDSDNDIKSESEYDDGNYHNDINIKSESDDSDDSDYHNDNDVKSKSEDDESDYHKDNDVRSESDYDDPIYYPKQENDDDNLTKTNQNFPTKQTPIKRGMITVGRPPKKVLSNDEEEQSDNKIIACKTCGDTFNTKARLSCHYKDNKNCRPHHFRLFKCEICEKEFSTSIRCKEHMNTHTGKTPHICSYCGKGFQLYSTYFSHVYKHRVALGEIEPKPGYTEKRVRLKLKCDLCQKVFASRYGFATHKLRHQGIKPYKRRPKKDNEEPKPKRDDKVPKVKNRLCTYCPKSFVTKQQLERHILVHTGEKPFICAYCKKRFVAKASLVAHEENHLGTHRFKCEPCNKPFSFKADYEFHRRTHTDENPLKCRFCNKCFIHRQSLKIHIRTHTGETPYACPVCGVRYYNKKILTRHQKNMEHLGEAVVEKINK